MTAERILHFRHLRTALERARSFEEEHGTIPWVWSDIQASPTTLTCLVVEGFVKVVGKDEYGRRLYQLMEVEKR